MVPDATYRLQLRPDFGFAEVTAVVPYLAALGVSHVYTSPVGQAVAGSMHGYDGVDPTRVDDELGGPDGWAALTAARAAAGLGHVVDVVPNHVSVADRRNRWWFDVLRNGRSSEHAHRFDIDWDIDDETLRGKVLLPILAAPLDDELAAGHLHVEASGDEWSIAIASLDTRLPIAPGSLAGLDAPTSPAALAELLARQHYVLSDWREGLTLLNYRRFFDVTTLVGLRIEEPDVFDDVHRLALGWVRDGSVDGLRIDHVDGLVDPCGYVRRLRDAAPDAWITVEKILGDDEQLPEGWPVDGTTGYDALAELTDVLVDPSAAPIVDGVYRELVPDAHPFPELVRRSKQQVVRELLRPELDRCTRDLVALLHPTVPDPGEEDRARRAVEAFVVELPVYRTYWGPGCATTTADRQIVIDTVARVRDHHPDVAASVLAVLADAFLRPSPDSAVLVQHVQQLSGPAMAKGVEDTAYYRDTRFVALDEVGGRGPVRYGASLADLHERCARRARHWPRSMVTTSTHDTKRSEDVRARLAVLSEVAAEWATVLRRWCARSAAWWPADVPRQPSLDVLVHQTLVGAHPLPADRAHAYLEKAMREAKLATSWLAPDAAFEAAAHGVLDRLLTDPEHVAEVDALAAQLLLPGRVNALAQKLLALTVPGIPDVYQGTELWDLHLVDPDNRALVDHDLRAELLATIAGEPTADDAETWSAGLSDPADPGIAKLAVVHHALRVRRRHRPAFVGPDATYEPLWATGAAADHVVAFVRGGRVSTVVPRHTVRCARAGRWRDTALALPPGGWHDVFTGTDHRGDVPIHALLATFPVALLVRT